VFGDFTIPRLPEAEIKTLAMFWHGIEEILNSLLFVMIGLSIAVVHTVFLIKPCFQALCINLLLTSWWIKKVFSKA
jgi:NhaP-type Na+/H+ or K+/H+ antiporter